MGARNLLPPTVVSRPVEAEAPTIGVALGCKRDNPTPKLAAVASRMKRLKAGS